MKKITFFSIVLLVSIFVNAQSTMTFSSGALEPGFSFTNWSGAGGAIYSSNLANPSTISDNSGTFTIYTFEVTGFLSNNTIEVTSNLGDSYTYSTNSAQIHTLNWAGISSLTFTRISGSGSASDHDNFVYAPSETLSIDTIEETIDLSIYPIPSNNVLNIKTTNVFTDISFNIYDLSGRQVASGKTVNNSIDINQLHTGNYMIEFLLNEKKLVKQFIKI